jgi:hypothetical protein
VKSCGAVTKANAAKDGAATRSQSAPAAAGTGKKIAGHSGGDGDPMVFNSVLVFYFTADCALGETHRRYQSGKDGRCQVTIIQDSRICTSMHTYSSDMAFPVHFSVVELSPNKSSFRASHFLLILSFGILSEFPTERRLLLSNLLKSIMMTEKGFLHRIDIFCKELPGNVHDHG